MQPHNLFFTMSLLALCSWLSFSQIPRTLSYQGVLTDSLGNPKPDGSYSLTFRLYEAESSGSVLWTEVKTLDVERGLFATMLGDQVIFNPTIKFDKPYWLSIQIASQPELSPRIPLTAVGYSLYSLKSDTAKFAISSPQQPFVDSARIAGTIPHNSITSQKILDGTIQRVDVVPTFTAPYADTASYARGTPAQGYVDSARIAGTAVSAATLLPGANVSGTIYNSPIVQITNNDSSSGGGYALSAKNYSHSTWRPAIYGENKGLSAGVYGRADNWNAVVGWNQSDNWAGVWGRNIGGGIGILGESDNGIGIRGLGMTGVLGETQGGSTSPKYGFFGTGQNTSSGSTYGGYFKAAPEGSGKHYGVYGYAENSTWTGNNFTYGGYFETRPLADGYHYGSYGTATTSIAYYVCGVSGYASNASHGFAYGGSFGTSDSGNGVHIALQGWANSSSPSGNHTTGIYASAENSSNGEVYGGRFQAIAWSGTGKNTGVDILTTGGSDSSTYGLYSNTFNSSTGKVYSGYFNAEDYGTGTKYGVYARAPISGWAGYFQGDLGVSNNLYVYGGTKSAAVQTDDGSFHALYCQESPENWFEDFGEGHLINGKITIKIDPLYAQTVNTSTTYHVFLTPHNEPIVLAVANRRAASFDVVGPVGSNNSFSYRIVIKRKGFENQRLTQVKGLTPAELEAEHERQRVTSSQHLQQLEEEREMRPLENNR
ncbi:MAG: hypothetical protein HZB59_00695 [Ignavibacteriales bacterium]|nr:hypothetical protein [Ignavibacteriales bacterium]